MCPHWENFYKIQREVFAENPGMEEDARRIGQEMLRRGSWTDVVNFLWEYWKERPCPAVMPFFLLELARGELHPGMRELLVLFFAEVKASEYWWFLDELLRQEEDPHIHETLMSTMANLAKPVHYARIVEIVADPSYGENRIFFLEKIARFGKDEGERIVSGYRSDPALGVEAAYVVERCERARERRRRRP